MKGRNKASVDRALPPAWVTLEWIMAERVDLYHKVQPPGEKTTIPVDTFQVE